MEKQKNDGALRSSAAVILEKLKDGTIADVIRDWKWIWGFSRDKKWYIIVYTLFGLLSSLLALATGVVSKYLIDAIVALDLSRLLLLIGLLVGGAVLGLLFRSLSARFSAKLNIAMQNTVQAKVFDSLMDSGWTEIRKYQTGDLLSRFSQDVSTVAGCAVSWLPGAIIQVVTVLATLGVILYYDPIMALIAFASTPVVILLSNRLIRRQRNFNRKMRETASGVSSFESETFRNIDTYKSFGVEENVKRDLRRWQKSYQDVALDYNLFSIQTNMGLTAMSTAVQYIALGYCLFRLWRGDILIGTMVLFLQQRASLSSALSALIGLVPTALSGSVAAERVRELTTLVKEENVESAQVKGSCELKLSGVEISYDDDEEKVLSGVDLHAGHGEIVALVGPSGEGKTTLLRLMLGLVRPRGGSAVLCDSAGDVYDLGPQTRKCFSYVPQGNTLIAGTVRENLRLGKENATDAEMTDALEGACAAEFVSKLAGGLDYMIGEGGKGLSEGQAQRIAIARALLRKAPVMLLDEVTSALDRETEKKVLSYLTSRGVTCIVTTHRPSVLSMCSRVYVVENSSVSQLERDKVEKMK